MVSVCLPSDALWQHLPSYLGFSYLGRGISPHSRPSWPWTWSSSSWPSGTPAAAAPWRWGSSSRAGPLTSDVGWLLSATAAPDLGHVVALWPPPLTQTWGSSSLPPLLRCHSLVLSVTTPDLGWGVAPHSHASAQCVAAGCKLLFTLIYCYI